MIRARTKRRYLSYKKEIQCENNLKIHKKRTTKKSSENKN
jgi:hypothetical protein